MLLSDWPVLNVRDSSHQVFIPNVVEVLLTFQLEILTAERISADTPTVDPQLGKSDF